MSAADDSADDQPWHAGLEKSWVNPFAEETPLYDLFDEIVREERDLIIILDDYFARRGTGKTIASLQLAHGMDQTETGVEWANVSMDVQAIRNAYTELPKRSGLVFDEGEVGASNRETQTNTNKALREIMSMGRVEQKYVIINSPAKEFIDKDLQKLADVWITMTRRGRGLVHFYERQPYSGKLLTPKKQWIEFADVPGDHPVRSVYHKLTRQKRQRMDGEGSTSWITQSEHESALRKAEKQARKSTRDAVIKSIYHHPSIDVGQSELGDAVGLTQQAISSIVND